MTSCKNVARIATAFLLLSLPMFGQYSQTITTGLEDNPADCVSRSCWTFISNNGLTGLVWITAGVDGTVYGIDSGDTVWFYDFSALKWSKTNLGAMPGNKAIGWNGLAVGSSSEIFAFSTATSNNAYQYVSGAWAQLGGSAECQQMAATYDGSVYCLMNGGWAYKYNGSNGWPFLNNPVKLTNLAVSKMAGLIGIGTDGNLYGFDGTNWHNNGMLSFTPSQTAGALGMADDLTVISIDTAGAIHLSRDGGSTWYQVSGYAALAATASSVMTLVADGSGVWHYSGTMPAVTVTTSGMDTSCPGCSPPGYHTGSASVSFPNGLNSGSTGGSIPHVDQMNYSHQDYSPLCDVIFFETGDNECQFAASSVVTCPVMGQLLNVSEEQVIEYVSIRGKYAWVGVSQNLRIYPITKIAVYDFLVDPWCSNGTPSPVLNVVTDTSSHPYWNTIAFYEGYAGHWHLLGAPGIGTTSTTKGSCSSLP